MTGASSFTASAANATITLGSDNLLTGAVALNTNGATGDATLTNNRALLLAASTVGGNLTIVTKTNTGAITQNGVLTVAGTSNFATQATSATTAGITLTQANKLTGAVSLNTGSTNVATLTNAMATVLGTSTVGGALTVTDSFGNLTQTGILTVTRLAVHRLGGERDDNARLG